MNLISLGIRGRFTVNCLPYSFLIDPENLVMRIFFDYSLLMMLIVVIANGDFVFYRLKIGSHFVHRVEDIYCLVQ